MTMNINMTMAEVFFYEELQRSLGSMDAHGWLTREHTTKCSFADRRGSSDVLLPASARSDAPSSDYNQEAEAGNVPELVHMIQHNLGDELAGLVFTDAAHLVVDTMRAASSE